MVVLYRYSFIVQPLLKFFMDLSLRALPKDGSRKEIHSHVHNMYTQSFHPDPACC
jgi:hypothetical protein